MDLFDSNGDFNFKSKPKKIDWNQRKRMKKNVNKQTPLCRRFCCVLEID